MADKEKLTVTNTWIEVPLGDSGVTLGVALKTTTGRVYIKADSGTINLSLNRTSFYNTSTPEGLVRDSYNLTTTAVDIDDEFYLNSNDISYTVFGIGNKQYSALIWSSSGGTNTRIRVSEINDVIEIEDYLPIPVQNNDLIDGASITPIKPTVKTQDLTVDNILSTQIGNHDLYINWVFDINISGSTTIYYTNINASSTSGTTIFSFTLLNNQSIGTTDEITATTTGISLGSNNNTYRRDVLYVGINDEAYRLELTFWNQGKNSVSVLTRLT